MHRLKQLREEFGLSQQYIAEKFNSTQQAWANYESGKREPCFKLLVEIAQFFDVSVDYLLGVSDTRKFPIVDHDGEPIDKEIYELAKLLQQATPDQIEMIKAFALSRSSQSEQKK